MRALGASTAWLLAGTAVFAALYWALLNTPESTVFTLALSLALALAIYVVMAATWSGALIAWRQGWSSQVPGLAMRGLGAFAPPLLWAGGVWWMIGRVLAWVDAHAGEIGAWFIATLDWSDVAWLITGTHWAGEWVRWVAAPFAALVWLGHVLARGWRPVVDRDCLRRACSPRRLLAATVIAGLSVFVPVQRGLYWVPAGLPPTWVAPAFALAKLTLIALVGAVGISLIVRLATPRED